MRSVTGFIFVAAAIGGLLLFSKRAQPVPLPTGNPPPAIPASVVSPIPITAPPAPSEHNWPKRALDRAADVKRQAADLKKENDQQY